MKGIKYSVPSGERVLKEINEITDIPHEWIIERALKNAMMDLFPDKSIRERNDYEWHLKCEALQQLKGEFGIKR